MIQLHYFRKHLPTGSVYIGTFNHSHVPDLQFLKAEHAERECKRALASWNRDPLNTDWVYDYIGVRNEEVAQYEREQSCLKASYI